MQDEESLVQWAKRGDQQAFTRLYEEHFDRIYRYVALRIGDRIEAEDMTQQVFLNAIQSISSFRWKGIPFAAWLFRIAHNQVVDYLRKKKKHPAVSLDESSVSSDSNPQLMAEHNLDIEQLLLATKRLTEAQREVISLRFTSGLSIARVSEIMGKSQGAVKALQHSAIVALRKALLVGDNEKVQRI
ncbi:sigma-70 family RNA polymerase sigma factor [Chloroflexota bacterium]